MMYFNDHSHNFCYRILRLKRLKLSRSPPATKILFKIDNNWSVFSFEKINRDNVCSVLWERGVVEFNPHGAIKQSAETTRVLDIIYTWP